MYKPFGIIFIVFFLFGCISSYVKPSVVTPTPTSMITPTPTLSPTAMPTITITPTLTEEPKPNATAIPTITPTPTATPIINSGLTQPTRNLSSSDKKLIWPVDCVVGVNCSIGYPDLDNNGKANCGYTYSGHEGTDIGFTWEQMDAGIDVYAAADGVVKWVFDGKYDRCTNSILDFNPDCLAPQGDMEPRSSSGYQVCTEAGDYCNERDKREKGWTTNCYWCFWGANVIVIVHEGNPYVFATRYDHLKTNSIVVQPGDIVKRGQKIAKVGSAGRSSGPHLHFEIWSDWYTPVDPWTPGCESPWNVWQSS